jgi:hypothetical protein
MRKKRTFIDIDKKYQQISSEKITELISSFLTEYKNTSLKIKLKEKIEWHRKYLYMNDEEFKDFNRLQKIAKKNKISVKVLVRLLIENYYNNN